MACSLVKTPRAPCVSSTLCAGELPSSPVFLRSSKVLWQHPLGQAAKLSRDLLRACLGSAPSGRRVFSGTLPCTLDGVCIPVNASCLPNTQAHFSQGIQPWS